MYEKKKVEHRKMNLESHTHLISSFRPLFKSSYLLIDWQIHNTESLNTQIISSPSKLGMISKYLALENINQVLGCPLS
jgi:hypothetical protein